MQSVRPIHPPRVEPCRWKRLHNTLHIRQPQNTGGRQLSQCVAETLGKWILVSKEKCWWNWAKLPMTHALMHCTVSRCTSAKKQPMIQRNSALHHWGFSGSAAWQEEQWQTRDHHFFWQKAFFSGPHFCRQKRPNIWVLVSTWWPLTKRVTENSKAKILRSEMQWSRICNWRYSPEGQTFCLQETLHPQFCEMQRQYLSHLKQESCHKWRVVLNRGWTSPPFQGLWEAPAEGPDPPLLEDLRKPSGEVVPKKINKNSNCKKADFPFPGCWWVVLQRKQFLWFRLTRGKLKWKRLTPQAFPVIWPFLRDFWTKQSSSAHPQGFR